MMARAQLRTPGRLADLFGRTRDPLDRAAVERIAALLADPAAIARHLAPALARIADDPLAPPRLDGIDNEHNRGVVLHRDSRLLATLTIVDFAAMAQQAPPIVSFASGHSLLVFHARKPVTVELYRSNPGPGGRHAFEAATAPKCCATGQREIHRGDWLMLARESDAVRVVRAAAPVPLVRVHWRAASPLPARRYRWPEGDCLGLTMASEEDARAQLIVSALRAMDRRDAIDALADVAQSEVFTLRWHAMRAWLAIDHASALPTLTRMAQSDRHREIRHAATAAMRMVDAVAA